MHRTLLIAFALVGATLSAQTITGGLHTGLSMPVGDLKDKQDWGTNQFFGAHIADLWPLPKYWQLLSPLV